MTTTFGSLFSGIGGADLGLIRAGLTPLWAVEVNPRIAHWHERNIGARVYVADVADLDPTRMERPDVLWASPPCTSFSVARHKTRLPDGNDDDMRAAIATARFIRALQPNIVLVENVLQYQQSVPFSIIRRTLDEMEYGSCVYKPKYIGVPQFRLRMILVARRGGLFQSFTPWPEQTIPGWHDAIYDVIQDFHETSPSNARMNVLYELKKQTGMCFVYFPSFNSNNVRYVVKKPQEPCFTITATLVTRQESYVIDDNGVIRAPTLRVWLRLQGLSDTTMLPGNRKLAGMMIGNAVPPPAATLAYQVATGRI